MYRVIILAVVLMSIVAGSAVAQDYPDLTIVNGRTKPPAAGVGENFYLSFDVKNASAKGAAAVTASITLSAGVTFVSSAGQLPCAAVSGGVACGNQNTAIGGNTSLQVVVQLRAPTTAGPMSFTATADPNNTIKELSETNNKASIGSQSYVRPKVQVTSNWCPSGAQGINAPYSVAFKLKNVGDVSVRYPAVSIQLSGGTQPFTITGVVPTSGAVPLNQSQTSYNFTYAWANQLAVGGELVVTLNLKSGQAHTMKATARALVENDNTLSDNSATCTVTIQ